MSRQILISALVTLSLAAMVMCILPPSSGGWGQPNVGPSSSSSSGKPLRGSQVYLQDPWLHEHDYSKGPKVGPHHKHGWGASSYGHGGGHMGLPDQATYIQRLWPVLQFSGKLKRISDGIQSLKPNKHWKWQAPALSLFGWDGTPHHVTINNQGGHGGQYENDGWSYNHGSHHIGHKVPEKTPYHTW